MQQKSILFITTADTDLLTADRALAALPDGFPPVAAVNPLALPCDEGRPRRNNGSGVRRRGRGAAAAEGKRAMPDTFDALARRCRSEGIPLIACPGHQEWDEDLVAACTVSAVEVETAFAYLMQDGVQNFFLFLSDTYFGTSHGHEAPAPLPWEGIYHPEVGDA